METLGSRDVVMELQVTTFYHFFVFCFDSVASLLSSGKFSFGKLSGCESVSLPENVVWDSNRAVLYFSFYLPLFFFFLSKGKIWPK